MGYSETPEQNCWIVIQFLLSKQKLMQYITLAKTTKLKQPLDSSSMPPIYPQIRPRHETTPPREQEHSRSLEVLRSPQSSQQGTGHPRLFDFWLGG
jgi:hypothetical protein